MSIPVIHLSRFLNGTPSERQAIARETDRVCRDIGFLSVVGHGVPDAVTSSIYDRAKAFFRLPAAEKQRLAQPGPDIVLGYIGFAKGALATTRGEATPPDLKESFNIGPETDARGLPRGPANLWPEEPGFRAAWLAYYTEMDRLSRDMMHLFAAALCLGADHFDRSYARHPSVLSAIYYPDQPEPPAAGQLRAGAHTDFGTMTILRPDDAPGGLQVMTKEGEWIPARATPNSFIINIGDMMARWTNDRWVSTLHRVVNPPRDMARGTERLSIGFFHQPDDDAIVECLPSYRGANGGSSYPPVRVGHYMSERFISQVVPDPAKA